MEIRYEKARWSLLQSLRDEAAQMMRSLADRHLQPLAYGSIARGDVKQGSDVDIFVPATSSPTIIEATIEAAGYTPVSREIIQATPTYAAKGYIHIKENRSYSFPLVELRPTEREFYDFAGTATFLQVQEGTRVSGVDKRLMLIEPTENGHIETPIQGREGDTAKKLGIGAAVIRDRVRILTRRERVGRTGVYLKRSLSPDETFGDVYHKLGKTRPPLRRRLR
jgi:hypothetical protein